MYDIFFYFLSKGFILRDLKYRNWTSNILESIIIFTRSVKFIITYRIMNCYEYYQKVIKKDEKNKKVIILYFQEFLNKTFWIVMRISTTDLWFRN